jgi:DNA-binding XRE family transcriptional regulator
MNVVLICKLKEIMKDEGTNPTKLAKSTGLTRETISLAANGKTCSLESALLIAQGLNRSIHKIWMIENGTL